MRGGLAGAAADRGAAEADAAGATRFQALRDAVAAGLNLGAALGIARAAGDAHAVGGAFTRATTQREIALTQANAILHAGDRTKPIA